MGVRWGNARTYCSDFCQALSVIEYNLLCILLSDGDIVVLVLCLRETPQTMTLDLAKLTSFFPRILESPFDIVDIILVILVADGKQIP